MGHGGGEVLEDGVKCQCCASVIEGIVDITGILSPGLHPGFLCLTGRGFTQEPHSVSNCVI